MSMKVGEIEVKFSHAKTAEGNPTATSCVVVINGTAFGGSSRCCKSDNFSYDTGRKLALKRAIAKTTLPKADKSAIWNAYRNMPASPRW